MTGAKIATSSQTTEESTSRSIIASWARETASLSLLIAVILAVALTMISPAAATPPPGATALCRDGTYSYAVHHSGACSHHGGVAEWLTGSPAPAGSSSPSTAGCGLERWIVKTLQDRPALLPVQAATIAYLVTRPAPSSLPPTRLPFERHVFRVTTRVTLLRREADGDLHLVLSDGTRTMIAEAPSSTCTSGATSARRVQMAQARTQARVCARAVVTGIVFFDFQHGQTGIAPNAIELHPVLAFRCLTA